MEPVDRISQVQAVKDALDDLRARVERLEAVQEIVAMEARYARLWDTTDANGWAALYLPDGSFRCVDLVGRPGFERRGHADLADFCRTYQRGMTRLHLLDTFEVVVDGSGAAHSRIAFECHRVETGAHPHIGMLTGYYETRYKREAVGWRIAERVEHLVFNREERYYVPSE